MYVTVNPFLTATILILLTSFLIWYFWYKQPPNGLPGTKGIPLFGVLFSLGSFTERLFQKWAKIYGPLYGVKVGTMDIVVISSPEIAYEAFAKNDCFNDRPQTVPMLSDGKGIIMINSTDFHREQRRFGLYTLREFGMGRRSLEPRLIEISRELCTKIDDLCGDSGLSGPFQIHTKVYEAISSVILSIVFGHDVGKESKEFQDLIYTLFVQNDDGFLGSLMLFAPFLRHLPFFSNIWKKSQELGQRINDRINVEIKAHQESHDPNNPRDFIDCFLTEMARTGQADFKGEGVVHSSKTWRHVLTSEEVEVEECSSDWKPNTSFFLDQLVSLVRDIFVAGTDTTATAVCWIVLYLCKYPDVQKKMQQEIDDVIGQSGVPKISLMDRFPYTRAVIQEVTRIRPIVPLNVPHRASRDATLMGYHIPKGAIILTNIWAIHHDENRWPEPEVFRPKRHLDENGKFVKSSNWMLFGVGTRSCLGQQLANMELLITTISLFQRFQFSFPPGTIPDMNGESIVSLRPLHFDVNASRR
ncbi:unnamed protein product [Clavelina lepadiformis]|uniref:Cytochrome P450 n=1 Tax=Clavelina lepadiformis TaxID=159417 RepID=A0ABP0GWD6_CLALP